jgi:hypothetical protein
MTKHINLAVSAFTAGSATSALFRDVLAVCGAAPAKETYNAARLAIQSGAIASYLARKGEPGNRGALIKRGLACITKLAGADGVGELKKGQTGRRTTLEEKAYASARVLCTLAFREAGVTVPGGGAAKSRTPKPAAKATAKKAAANNNRPAAAPKCKDGPAFAQYVGLQAAALLAAANKNAKVAPPAILSAIQDFAAAVKQAG